MSNIIVRTADAADIDLLAALDRHISRCELKNIIRLGRVLIIQSDGTFAGWLRYGLFWDNTPFMNMLYIMEEYRGKGLGRALVAYWEQKMAECGYSKVMTSTASDEYAQHFYNKLGYKTVGGFTPSGDPFELILSKHITQNGADEE